MGLCADSTAKEETQVRVGSGLARVFPKPLPLVASKHNPTAYKRDHLLQMKLTFVAFS